jgi:hypothetical protein
MTGSEESVMLACSLMGWEGRQYIFYWTLMGDETCRELGLPLMGPVVTRVSIRGSLRVWVSRMGSKPHPYMGGAAFEILEKARKEYLNLCYGNCEEAGGEGLQSS